MQVPGSNLLQQAAQLIAFQTITYLAYVSRALQSNRLYVSTYASAVTFRGSLQPVGRKLMLDLGLDLQKQYVNIFVSHEIVDIDRDVSSDRFQFQGFTYQALSITPWLGIDGWNQCLAVRVPGPFQGIISGESGVPIAGENDANIEGDAANV